MEPVRRTVCCALDHAHFRYLQPRIKSYNNELKQFICDHRKNAMTNKNEANTIASDRLFARRPDDFLGFTHEILSKTENSRPGAEYTCDASQQPAAKPATDAARALGLFDRRDNKSAITPAIASVLAPARLCYRLYRRC